MTGSGVGVISSLHIGLESWSLDGRSLIDQWWDRWWAPGVVKDSCQVKMWLPLSSKKAQRLSPFCFLKYTFTPTRMFKLIFPLFAPNNGSFLCCHWKCLSGKLSHIRGQWTTASQRGFWLACQLFLSLSLFLPFILHYPAIFLHCPEWREMLKMWWFTPSAHLIPSCHCLIRRKTEMRKWSQVRTPLFLSRTFYFLWQRLSWWMWSDRLSSACRYGVDTVVQQPPPPSLWTNTWALSCRH